ncbi:MAG: hypothetical protein AB1635_07880 [Acidobacteriota bacterium]
MRASPDTWTRVCNALIAADPTVFSLPRRGGHRARRLARLAAASGIAGPGLPLAELVARVDDLAVAGPISAVGHLRLPADRRPLIAAHGPSLDASLPAIQRARDRIWLVAPFRTALVLAARGVVPDVTVLADRGHVPYAVTAAAWADATPAVRERLARASTLVIEPLAPRNLQTAFARVAIFDPGLGVLPPAHRLPFWGYALVPAFALPVALGAREVAIVGIDLAAATGPARKTWAGAPVRLDGRMATLLALLEELAAVVHAVDLSATALRKRGFVHRPPEFLTTPPLAHRHRRAPAAGAARVARMAAVARARIAAQLPVIDRLHGHAREALALLETPDAALDSAARARLAALVHEALATWPRNRSVRMALDLTQPTFLPAVWQAGAPTLAHLRASPAALRRTARLIFGDLADVTADCRRAVEPAPLLRGLEAELGSRDAGLDEPRQVA